MASQFRDVDEYINTYPEDVRTILERIRATIRESVPGVGETIKYQMPTMTLRGRSLVHFAAWKRHIGLYPLPIAYGALAEELAPYATPKGIAQFKFSEPVPYDLIGRAVAALAAQLPE